VLDLDTYYAELPWLIEQRTQFEQLVSSGRWPHALLLHGPAGTGRRQLALWFIESLLDCDLRDAAVDAEAEQDIHPDLLVVEPEADKKAIGIEQIRELIEFMQLTSHQGGARSAVIYPAEHMTISAANSLLKTLEEPPENVALVLLCESINRLPATVISRCQRSRLAAPPAEAGLKWLAGQVDSPDLEAILDFTGGAPLAALDLCQKDFPTLARGFNSDLDDLSRRRVDPVTIAARWAKQGDLALRWLYCFIAGRLREELASGSTETAQSGQIGRYFRQLDKIRELRRFIGGGVSAELGLTDLLMEWYGDVGHNREI